jgi:biopolymer transport protein ExbB
MIRAFTVIALEGTGDPQQLAGGISEALLTTASGLAIAIPCLIAHQTFESQIDRQVLDIQQASTEMINALLIGRRSTEGSSSS